MINRMEQTMSRRNDIQVLDPQFSPPRFGDLEVGEMFSYDYARTEGNVYMKVNDEPTSVLLTTGQMFKDFNTDRPITRIKALKISR